MKKRRSNTLIHLRKCIQNLDVILCIVAVCLELSPRTGNSQQAGSIQATAQQIQQLSAAITKAQKQLESSEQEIQELQRQLAALQAQLATTIPDHTSSSMPTAESDHPTNAELAQKIGAIQERQAMQQSQIATHEQVKIESESKYPVKLTGLILFNGFVNTKAADVIQSPTLAIGGQGSTGASLRQTILGLDALGPHLFGAASHADVRVDFFGGASLQGGYGSGGGVLRLRTAHSVLSWKHTEVFANLDRPLINPNAPTSLTTVATPALAWSGNLWSWSPQLGVTERLAISSSAQLKVQAALIDVADPAIPEMASTSNTSLAERSKWPGSEVRIALATGTSDAHSEFGFGGYFSPHQTRSGLRFNAWAGTMDYRLFLPGRLELSGNFYRGLALGGLGGGAYKDYIYSSTNTDKPIRTLDDVGGWTQLKERVGERLEFNAAMGIDNIFSSELGPYYNEDDDSLPNADYRDLARNKTFFTNIIYSPSAYLLFSLEFRRIQTSPVVGSTVNGNVFGLAAGYKF